MAIEITLEADARLDRAQVKASLHECGASITGETGNTLTATFPNSITDFLLRDQLHDSRILTEGMESAGWIIGSRLTFRYSVANFDQCERDLGRFLQSLAVASSAYFVVAFQYEEVKARRDANGLKIF